jgi:transposase
MGPDAQAMTALLKDKLGVSYGDIPTIFKDFFGIPITPGGACQIVLRVAQRTGAAYQGILSVVRRSRILYPDETGWKVAGLLQWMWVFVTRTATLFAICDSRGHDVLAEILGLGWPGKTTHDGWRPYDFLERALHQQCLGHLIRRAECLLETATRGAVRFPRAVLRLLQDSLALRDRREAGTISPHGLSVATGRLEGRLVRLLDHIPTHPGNHKFARHLIAHEQELFPFLKHPGLEPTGCLADQAIRPAVVNRKVFGGNRDPSGARAQEILSSIAATAVQRGVAIFDYLSRVLRAAPRKRDSLACRLLELPAPA